MSIEQSVIERWDNDARLQELMYDLREGCCRCRLNFEISGYPFIESQMHLGMVGQRIRLYLHNMFKICSPKRVTK